MVSECSFEAVGKIVGSLCPHHARQPGDGIGGDG
jgi:hypothetical protein